jgi:hypothetical protein
MLGSPIIGPHEHDLDGPEPKQGCRATVEELGFKLGYAEPIIQNTIR